MAGGHGERPGRAHPRRRRHARAAPAPARQFQAVFDCALDALCIFDDQRRYTAVNAAACRLFGESRRTLLRRRLGEGAAPGQEAQFAAAWQAFQQRGHLQGEFQICRADGTIREVEFNARAHIQPQRHLAVIRDVTDQKAAVRALRQSEERFARAFHASPSLLAIIHLPSGRIIDANACALAWAGWPRTAVLGQAIRTPRLWTDPAAWDGLLTQLQYSGGVRDFEATLRTAGGAARVCSLAAEIITLAGEGHVLLLGQDITERRAVEAEVAAATAAQQAAHARLQELHALQTALVATVSHEFRTPLTAIQGFAALLTSEDFTPAQVREYAATIHTEALRLGRLVTDLVTMAHPTAPATGDGSAPPARPPGARAARLAQADPRRPPGA